MKTYLNHLKNNVFLIDVHIWLLVFAVILIVSLSLVIACQKNKAKWFNSAPSLITTTGIFCTFLGVSIGLIQFNPNNVNSLNDLLSGLKLAFMPSAVAIFIAILFKIVATRLYQSDSEQLFIEKLEQNTSSINKLAEAVSLVDWQVEYKHNLEQNIEQNSELLTIMESGLTELINTLNEKPAEVINHSNVLLAEIGQISSALNQFNEGIVPNQQKLQLEQQNITNALKQMYFEFDNFKKSFEQLKLSANNIDQNLKNAVSIHIRNLEVEIKNNLKQVLLANNVA